MRTETPQFIASASILRLRSDGSEMMIDAKIGTPYQVDARAWACPASLEGGDGRYPDIVGEGSFQSLSLAVQLIARRLGHMLDDNEQLVYPSDRSPWTWSSYATGTPSRSRYSASTRQLPNGRCSPPANLRLPIPPSSISRT